MKKIVVISLFIVCSLQAMDEHSIVGYDRKEIKKYRVETRGVLQSSSRSAWFGNTDKKTKTMKVYPSYKLASWYTVKNVATYAVGGLFVACCVACANHNQLTLPSLSAIGTGVVLGAGAGLVASRMHPYYCPLVFDAECVIDCEDGFYKDAIVPLSE